MLLKTFLPSEKLGRESFHILDFNLVDPDNRRSVDYGKRREWLDEIKRRETEDRSALPRDLLTY